MSSQFSRLNGISIFDDKGEVKRLVESLIQDKDPDVAIERLRKMDFSYVFTLFKKAGRKKWSWHEMKLKPVGSGEKGISTESSRKR